MNMENIDLIDIVCFGYSMPKKNCWLTQLKTIADTGWKSIDFEKFEDDLNHNVVVSYNTMARATFKDLDTDFKYLCAFNNEKKLWTLEIPGSPADAIDPADRSAFFKSETFVNLVKKIEETLAKALENYEKYIKPKLEAGDLINVDETKAEAVEFYLNDPDLRKNLRMGKFAK